MEGFSVEGQSGSAVMNMEGKLLSSSGELSGQAEVTKTVYSMLQDAAKVLTAEGKAEPFKRLTITFKSSQYLATIVESRIYLVKKPTAA